MNKVLLTGRITHDLELRNTPDGIAVLQFSIAVKRPRVKDKTDFIRVVCWRSNAEFVSKYFKKGDGIEVSGVMTQRTYEDKEGNKRESVEVLADECGFPVSTAKSSDGNEAATAYSNANETRFEEMSVDEDLPF